MERIGLLVMLGCSVLGVGLSPEGRRPAPKTALHERLPAISPRSIVAVISPEQEAQDEVIRQIMQRFSVRHTALPERERIALAHTIVREAKVQNLDPRLVMAVIEVESAGDHRAESHVGALGLMQLLPSTGKELAGKMGIPCKGDDTLFDPTINIQLGTAYLRELKDRYDGNVSTALAAYNWGPGRIDRRIRRGAIIPSKYIEQVMSAVVRYAAMETPIQS
jgi:soluble lytic murein transglycosylase-like protein